MLSIDCSAIYICNDTGVHVHSAEEHYCCGCYQKTPLQYLLVLNLPEYMFVVFIISDVGTLYNVDDYNPARPAKLTYADLQSIAFTQFTTV